MIFLFLGIALALNSDEIITQRNTKPEKYDNGQYNLMSKRCNEEGPRSDVCQLMFDEFNKFVAGQESYFFLGLQPIYKLVLDAAGQPVSDEVAQYEVLQRQYDGTNTSMGALFRFMNAQQWQQFVMANVKFAIEVSEEAQTDVSINLPAFLLGREYSSFIDEFINPLKEKSHVIVEISEKGLGNIVAWKPEFVEGIKKLHEAKLRLALDDISRVQENNTVLNHQDATRRAQEAETQLVNRLLNEELGFDLFVVMERARLPFPLKPFPITLDLAEQLYDMMNELKIDMTDVSVMFEEFPPDQGPFLPNQRKNMRLFLASPVANQVEDEFFTKIVKRAFGDRKKVVFEWSIQNVVNNLKSEEHKNLLLQNLDLFLIQGGKTADLAISKEQLRYLLEQERYPRTA